MIAAVAGAAVALWNHWWYMLAICKSVLDSVRCGWENSSRTLQ